MPTSQRFDFDEIPIRTKDGAVVAYAIFDGYVDLIVGHDGAGLHFDGYENVFVKNDEGKFIALDEDDPLSVIIEFEIDRLIDGGDLRPERQEPDPDYLRDLRLDAAE